MKYFNPSYWFKLLVLSAPLFNDKIQGINAMSIDNNQKIKNWASNNTNLQSINQEINYTNSTNNYQSYNFNLNETNQNVNPFYQSYLDLLSTQKLKISTHKNRHEKRINKRVKKETQELKKQNIWTSDYLEFNNKYVKKIGKEINTFVADSNDNVYFGIKNKLFVLKPNETNATKFIELLTDMILLEIDNKDNMYLSTNNSLYVLKNGEDTPTKINGINENISQLVFNNDNNLYIGTNNGIYTLKQNETQVNKINGINENISQLVFDNDNNLYIGTNNGIYTLKQNETQVNKINGINSVNSMLIDKSNNIYVATGSKYFTNYDNNVCIIKNGEKTTNKVNFNFGLISTLVFDNDNNLYIGTNNGIYTLKQNETQVNKINGINEFIFSLSIDSNNNLYIATDRRTYLYKNNKLLQLINKKTNNYYESLIKVVKNNNIFIKINKILYYLTDLNLSIIFKKIDGVPSSSIDLIEIDGKDNVYIGTNYDKPQILKWNEGKAYNIDGIIDHKFFWITIDKNDNVYFGSINGLFVLKNGEKTAKRIDLTIGTVNKIKFDNDNNLYIGTNNGIYTLKQNETQVNKINGINENISQLVFDNDNNLYIGTNNGLYFLKNGETIINKINNLKNYVLSLVVNKDNNIYIITEKKQSLSSYVSDNYVFVLKNDEHTLTKIKGIDYENIRSLNLAIDNDNNLYIGTNNGIYTLKSGKTKVKRSNWSNNIDEYTKIKFDSEKNMYISANDGLYVLKNGEDTPAKINGINKWVNNFIIDSNDNILFIDRRINFGILQNTFLINSIIKNINLKKINNDYDETILNTINYLNRESNYFLNLNKMKVINKTLTSATIKAIKGKYRGQITVDYKIKNQNEIDNIILTDLFKRAIYFDFIDNNYHVFKKIKHIKYINIDNLNFWNIEITRDSELLYNVNFKNACFNKKEKINRSSITKTLKIPKCEYNTTSKIYFQITKGLTKTEQENKTIAWNIDIEDEIKLGDFINISNKDSEIINTLSENFDISNINKQEQEMVLVSFNEDEEELQVAPKERVEFKYSVREINLETSLNLKQKITGTFSAKIINDENQEETIILSVKEAIQTLQKYSLLPNEFNINEDNSITFNGKAKISLTQEADPKKIENYFSI